MNCAEFEACIRELAAKARHRKLSSGGSAEACKRLFALRGQAV